MRGPIRARAIAVPIAILLASFLIPTFAEAVNGNCGVSDGDTLCVSVPDGPLSGQVTVTVTDVTTNKGTVIVTWIPNGGSPINLITKFKKSPEFNNYSFVWPTQKYLDAPGTLRVQHGSTSSTPVDVSVTLANGNTSDFQHSPNDWASYLPGVWDAGTDPIVAAVGDAAADEPLPNGNAASIAATSPALFLYLGDVYENDTFTELLNHYGVNSMDGTAGTLWGAMGAKTQPTLGNHDSVHLVDWKDYWHGHPDYTSFTFGGTLFLDLNSNRSMSPTSAQYKFVQNALATAPPCVVSFWHAPTLAKDNVTNATLPMWKLLANNGGDLVLNGHQHFMADYLPLDANLQLGGHMVELISGSGGHGLNAAGTDTQGRLKWTLGKVTGAVYVTLNGAANGGTASSLSWSFQDVSHNVLDAGSVGCGAGTPPTASFTATPPSGPAPLDVSFTDTSSPGSAPIQGWAWDFGDGSTSTQQNPMHTFNGPGTYTVRLTVTTSVDSSTTTNTVTANQAGSVVPFNPTDDSYVKSSFPTVSYGAEATMRAKLKTSVNPPEEFRPYLQFSVQGLSGTPTSATLRLFVTDGGPSGGTWYTTATGWGESTINWNNAPAILDANAITTVGSITAGTWLEIDVSSIVTGNGSYGFAMKTLNADIDAFSSKEGTNPPQLVVTT